MKRSLIFFGFLIACLICFLAASQCFADDAKPLDATKAPRVSGVVPFTLGSDGRMYVHALINKTVQATFLIDTGNDVNYLSSEIQNKLHLPLGQVTDDGKPEGKPSQIDGKIVHSITPATIVMGDMNLIDTGFILLPGKKLPESIVASSHVDGVLGSRLLERFALLLDFSASQIRFWYPGGLTKQDIKALNLYILYTVPLRRSPSNPDIWMAHMQFVSDKGTAENEMMVDTGASITTISSETADQLKLTGTEVGKATLFLNKQIPIDSAQVMKMQTADFVLLSHPVFYPEESLPSYPVSLGMDIFRGYMPLIDFGQQVMYLASTGIGANIKSKN